MVFPRAKENPLIKAASRGLSRALDTVLPAQTLLSLDPEDETAPLWQAVKFLDEPCCDACGFPFDYAAQAMSLCLRCAAYPPTYDRARSAMAYDDASRQLILSFKHGGRTNGLGLFTTQMSRAGRTLLAEADIIVPVPLHTTRLRRRRYNQSAILGRSLAQMRGLTFDPDSLLRKRATDTQGGKSAMGRRRNVKGAFHVPDARRNYIASKRIVLIDDVMTTGATLEACAKTLKRAGAAHVDGLCLARVVRAANLPT
ncbi:ComF family protein [Litorimonas sp. RW-G-Af-16]|uniref:ComF family protein n=1 Tax=Litorimonas sp. RW-G-Af-16 TaxID=3241168 RepID=UPI00390CA0BC